MEQINKVKSISIWVFIVPFVAINACLILTTQFHEFNLIPDQFKISYPFPYLDGGVSISRTARYFPTYLIFKPAMFLTAYLLIIYWLNNRKIINQFDNSNKYRNKIVYFGIASAIALILHSIFLGVKFDNDLYKLFRRIIMFVFIIFEIVAQAYLVTALYSMKDKIFKHINKNISNFLGVKKFKFGELEQVNKIGIVVGLAWTEFGGEILKIETVNMPGKGRMQITGKLGDVMQESVKAAKSFVRSKSLEYGIIPPTFEKKDFHIHVPEGATPKDGPSAGIGMVTSIVSSITNIPVDRELAMTGEVTLTGQVLPIGGLKEKLLAAHRAGIKKVLIPKENEKDLADVPKKVKEDIKIIPVENADEVIKIALTKEPKPIEWTEVEKISDSKKDDKSQASIQ